VSGPAARLNEMTQQGRNDRRRNNVRLGWILLSIALAFFVGVILNRMMQ